jgi:hypothetical protein
LTAGRLPPIICTSRIEGFFAMRTKKLFLFALGILTVVAALLSVKKLKK